MIRKHKKGAPRPWEIEMISIAHAIMHAIRPRSFVSNILLGLAGTIGKKFGSNDLIDLLSAMGVCSSYVNLQLLESSILPNNSKPDITGYVQKVSDNTDWNTKTEFGHGTFHASGNILCDSS